MNKLCHTQAEWQPGLPWKGIADSLTGNMSKCLNINKFGLIPGPFMESYARSERMLTHVTVTDMRDGTVYVIGRGSSAANGRRTIACTMLNLRYWEEFLGGGEQ
jgi:hypothetical protein